MEIKWTLEFKKDNKRLRFGNSIICNEINTQHLMTIAVMFGRNMIDTTEQYIIPDWDTFQWEEVKDDKNKD